MAEKQNSCIYDVISLGPWSVNPVTGQNGVTLYEILDLQGNRIGMMKNEADAHVAIAGSTILDRWQYVYELFGQFYHTFGSAFYASLGSAGIKAENSKITGIETQEEKNHE